MIQPVNALSPKVLFRGDEINQSRIASEGKTLKTRLALFNAGGISVGLGAATTAIARSNTSSWKHAGYYGVGAALVSMMFLVPGFLYKAGLYTTKNADKEMLLKEKDVPKKFLAEVGDITTVKSASKATIKVMPKV